METEEGRYLEILVNLLNNGTERGDRTGIGTNSLFGQQLRFDVGKSFPLITTKKMAFNNMVHELLWFISGSTNVNELPASAQKWWRPWADKDGSLGPTYGKMLRNIEAKDGREIDQLAELISSLKENPNSRRHIIALWNPEYMPKTNLPCCHGTAIQFFVYDGKLSCSMYQRSGDFFIGAAVNISTYALLLNMIAQVCGYKPHELIITIGDCHLYHNHLEQAKLQLTRQPYPFPQVELNPEIKDIDDFKYEDIKLVGYKSHPAIKAPIAV